MIYTGCRDLDVQLSKRQKNKFVLHLLAKNFSLHYNKQVRFAGVWCSGSTSASDSDGVGSIPTTPAKK